MTEITEEPPTGSVVDNEASAAAVGDLIRARREARGLSQRELGLRVGKSQTGVNYWESGKRNLNVLDLIDVARALEVAPATLIPGGHATPEPVPFVLPLRLGGKYPHQTIYDATEQMIAAGMTPEKACWLVDVANTRHLLTWLISASVDTTIGVIAHGDSVALRVALDLDDDPAFVGYDLSDLLAQARAYCEREGITP